MKQLRLKKGKEKAARHQHPWLFSGAVESEDPAIEAGEVVRVIDSEGAFVGYGYYSISKIKARMLEWEEANPINENWWRQKIENALHRRRLVGGALPAACRLIFSESDLLPGLIADKYDQTIVVQFLTAGIEKVSSLIVQCMVETLHPLAIHHRADAAYRAMEGLGSSDGTLYGALDNRPMGIEANGLLFSIHIGQSQKTGYYLDQKENREKVADRSTGKKILDCFCYHGGFGLTALHAGAAHVTFVDSSATAIEGVRRNCLQNRMAPESTTIIQGDVNKVLRTMHAAHEFFDLIVLDPPKLSAGRSMVQKAQKAYKDLNLRALQLLHPGGLLATFSCSASIEMNLFTQIVTWACLDAGKKAQVIGHFSQPEDHPVLLSFPESNYLKGLLVRVLE